MYTKKSLKKTDILTSFPEQICRRKKKRRISMSTIQGAKKKLREVNTITQPDYSSQRPWKLPPLAVRPPAVHLPLLLCHVPHTHHARALHVLRCCLLRLADGERIDDGPDDQDRLADCC